MRNKSKITTLPLFLTERHKGCSSEYNDIIECGEPKLNLFKGLLSIGLIMLSLTIMVTLIHTDMHTKQTMMVIKR